MEINNLMDHNYQDLIFTKDKIFCDKCGKEEKR